MKIVTLWISAFVYLNLTNGSFSQSAIEHHVWQDHRKFEAFSRTAVAITGSINLSGNSFFAKPGSTMKMTFANGKSVKLTQVLAAWRHWGDIDDRKVTAEVFRLDSDPGKLLNGNTLCGSVEKINHIYAVFYDDTLLGTEPLLELAIFRSQNPPFDKNSQGLCGTFNFYVR